MNNAKNTTLFPYLERLLEGEAVEWKTLGEVCDILRGKRLTKKELSEEGKYAVFHGGLVPIGFYSESNRKGDTTMVINVGASAGTIGYSRDDFWSSDGCFCISPSPFLLSRFIFYVLQSKDFQIKGKVRIAGIPTLDSNVLEQFPIPIPPLRVQARIVEILDKFTQLEAELEAELEARRKQYAYYLDQLLNFSQYPPLNVNIEWKTLGEIAELYSGLSGKTKEHFQKGNAPYVTYKNIFDNLAVDSSILEMVSIGADERQHAVKYGDVLITGSSENIEEVGMSSVVTFHPEKEIYLNSFSFGIRFHSAVQLSPEFTKYLFRSELLRKQIMKTASGVTRFNVSKKKFSEITLPIPPLSEQRRIVDILDRFDTLTNSISEGLPKEIALRRKQYAYYRDALLSFPRPEVSA